MEQPHTHSMNLVRTHESGAEEWHCPECGRRFIMQWPPHYKRIVLEAGDEMAMHSASKGGLQMNAAIAPSTEVPPPAAQDAGELNEQDLDIWLDHLNKLDFGDDTPASDQ